MRNDDLNIPDNTGESRKYLNPRVGIALSILIILNYFLSPIIFEAMGVDYPSFIYLAVIWSYTIVVFSLIFFSPVTMEVFRDKFTLSIIILSCFYLFSSLGRMH
jgi:hypothetical protein